MKYLIEYKSEHEAPNKHDDPLHDISDTFPDMYKYNAARLYASGFGFHLDNPVIQIIQSSYNKPNKRIKIYRAVPLSNDEINYYKKYKEVSEIIKFVKKNRIFPPSFGHTDYIKNIIDNAPDKIKLWDTHPSYRISYLENFLPPKPKNKREINSGDWVTLSKPYALNHAKSVFRTPWKILSKTVKASELYTDGNSIHEWGWNP